jgi:hypothetical protein
MAVVTEANVMAEAEVATAPGGAGAEAVGGRAGGGSGATAKAWEAGVAVRGKHGAPFCRGRSTHVHVHAYAHGHVLRRRHGIAEARLYEMAKLRCGKLRRAAGSCGEGCSGRGELRRCLRACSGPGQWAVWAAAQTLHRPGCARCAPLRPFNPPALPPVARQVAVR